jgi:APA family basic amino acid/polyamine antiporter
LKFPFDKDSGRGLFAVKPIQDYQTEASSKQLARALGIPALIAFGVGSIIGSGIFVLTGLAAAQHAGPAVTVSFVIAGIGCLFAGLCYSEFAAILPVCGSAYAYSYATLGEFIAWVVGWNLVLEYMMSCSTVAVGWSSYLAAFLQVFHIDLPQRLSNAPFASDETGFEVHSTGALLNLPAVAIVLAATALCYRGIRESTIVNTIIVVIKVAIVLAVITCGASYVSPANWVPYIPANTGTFGHFGWSGIFQASAIVFFAYIGFDSVSTVAQEAKDPARAIPTSILWSLGICTLLYVLMSGVMTGLVSIRDLNDAAPVAAALKPYSQLAWLNFWVLVGALAGLTSVIITLIIPQARIWLTMAQDGLLPGLFGAIHPRFRTPHLATMITGVTAAIFAGLFPIGILGELVSIGTLVAFMMVCIGVLVLRHTQPELPRPFRVRWVWLVSSLGVLFCGLMAYSLPNATWMRLLVWSALGLLVYFSYGYQHSRVRSASTRGTLDSAGT